MILFHELASPVPVMLIMIPRRLLLLAGCAFALSLAIACTKPESEQPEKAGKLIVGVVTYGEGARSVDQYHDFVEYLGNRTKTLIELEPAYNEIKAVEQIQRKIWSVVFAPPGLAAIAISRANYRPLFPLQGIDNLSSVLVVLQDSPIEKISDLNNKNVALGQPGSATGYYVPLYNLYGLILSEVRFAPTPRTVLEWVANGEVAAGALSKDEFNRYQQDFNSIQFRILLNSRRIPAGAVLISPEVDANQQRVIQKAMNEAVPQLVQTVGYVPNLAPPDYKTLITFIDKVKPIEGRIRQKPAPLFQPGEQANSPEPQ